MNKKSIVITIIISVSLTISSFIADVLNIPTKMGVSIHALNNNLWSVLLGNIIVITLFVITFLLFDKRNLEKDQLGKFAGVMALKSIYREVDLLVGIIEKHIEELEKKEKNAIKKDYSLIDFFDRKYPFENDDMIFELLQNGYISKVRYQNYYNIKDLYNAVILSITEFPKSTDMAKAFFDKLKEKIEPEIEALNEYEESL